MMEFEFQESEVIFGDLDPRIPDKEYTGQEYRRFQEVAAPFRRNTPSNKRGKNTKRSSSGNSSPPVDIPGNILPFRDIKVYSDNDEDGDEGEMMVPPHLMVDRRRIDGKVACSVCFGHGRTLKGRHLRQVRNSVLRMTGFLES